MPKTILFVLKLEIDDHAEPREIRDDLLESAEEMHGVIMGLNAWYEDYKNPKG